MLRQMKSASAMMARMTRIVISMSPPSSRWIEWLALVRPPRCGAKTDAGRRKPGPEAGNYDQVHAGEREATLALAA